MMTIRHVEPDGQEEIFQVSSVRRTREGHLTIGTEREITQGKIYVMNDAGKTVAVYDFEKHKGAAHA